MFNLFLRIKKLFGIVPPTNTHETIVHLLHSKYQFYYTGLDGLNNECMEVRFHLDEVTSIIAYLACDLSFNSVATPVGFAMTKALPDGNILVYFRRK